MKCNSIAYDAPFPHILRMCDQVMHSLQTVVSIPAETIKLWLMYKATRLMMSSALLFM